MKFKSLTLILLIIIGLSSTAQADIIYDPSRHCYVDESTGECIPNTILSSLPFLTIIPDARGAALGDAGIAISPDPSAMHFNAAKIAMSEKEFELSTTYTPWLKNLGLNDIYLAYLSGYNKFDKLQGIGYSIRYFSLGEIQFTNSDRENIGTGNPNEFEVAVAYARKLSDNFSAALTGKFVYSNLAEGQRVDGVLIEAATAFAADLSMYYKSKVNIGDYKSKLTMGLTLSNLGNKITYTKDADTKEYLPQNLGIGAALEIPFDDYNTITLTADLNKLLLPTPTIDTAGIVKYNESPITAALESFSDAPGGFVEEMREITYSLGAEYWYDKQFAIRAGYFYEHPLKGDRQFLTLGLGLRYNVYSMGVSYLVPTNSVRNPLDGTLRFTFSMDFTKTKYKE
ncbi:MAG: type IX secretion system outer membrane channel protein PorV [Saprospiraceae bacterium]|nr:type IX secretion system outer membrane channel protein PorV [Saprospiraceae bacterium]